MKKQFRTVALIATLGFAAISCQKETTFTGTPVVQTDTMVYFSVNGDIGFVNLYNDEMWDAFIDRMMALAKEGYQVTISRNATSTNSATKETVVYTTDDETEAHNWAKKMTKEGYQVSITFDSGTGIWTCIATK